MAQYIYGKNVVLSRLEKGDDIEKIYLVEGFKDKKILEKIKCPKEVVKASYLDKLCCCNYHQGIVAKVKVVPYTPLEVLLNSCKDVKYPLLVVLDGVEDPHNLGAITRSCDAIGANGIIVPKHGSAPLTSTVVKVSTGAIDYVPIAQVTNLTNTLKKLQELGFWVVGAEASNSQDYRTVDYKCPIVLVMGSEGKGISRLVLEQCDFKVNLPMVGHVNSLNVSNATAILLYQIYSDRNPVK